MTRVVGDVDVLNEMFSSGVVAVCGDVFLLVGDDARMKALEAYMLAKRAGVKLEAGKH